MIEGLNIIFQINCINKISDIIKTKYEIFRETILSNIANLNILLLGFFHYKLLIFVTSMPNQMDFIWTN